VSGALVPYLESLRHWCREQERLVCAEEPASLALGGEVLVVGPWERSQLQLYFRSGSTQAPEPSRTLVHGLALITKCALDVENLQGPAAAHVDACYAKQGELMHDAELAAGILERLQRAIDEHVAQGKIQNATALTHVRNRLKRAVTAVARESAASEWGVVEEWFDGITDPPAGAPAEPPAPARSAPRTATVKAATAAPVAEPAPRRRPRLAAPVRRRAPAGRTALLAAACGLLALAWVGGFWLPRYLSAPPKALGLADLARGGPFTAVTSRHPSLFLTADADAWAELTAAERLQRLELLGGMLRRRDYAGAIVLDPDGRIIASWLAGRGAQLVAATAPGAVEVDSSPDETETAATLP
jgi:hypothetical protein